jgi:hypothetical protein
MRIKNSTDLYNIKKKDYKKVLYLEISDIQIDEILFEKILNFKNVRYLYFSCNFDYTKNKNLVKLANLQNLYYYKIKFTDNGYKFYENNNQIHINDNKCVISIIDNKYINQLMHNEIYKYLTSINIIYLKEKNIILSNLPNTLKYLQIYFSLRDKELFEDQYINNLPLFLEFLIIILEDIYLFQNINSIVEKIKLPLNCKLVIKNSSYYTMYKNFV